MVVSNEPVCCLNYRSSNVNIGEFFATRKANIWCHLELTGSILADELM